ncbi:hypothetical protein Ciccas_000851 [Cichlidogyrus casuarinus]|uniref:Uncharacterized protein n=1 Tax=Cichlidogyrus casuarinus TaxID=1844966 RepID=A0ABD2QLQ9_9PLAT
MPSSSSHNVVPLFHSPVRSLPVQGFANPLPKTPISPVKKQPSPGTQAVLNSSVKRLTSLVIYPYYLWQLRLAREEETAERPVYSEANEETGSENQLYSPAEESLPLPLTGNYGPELSPSWVKIDSIIGSGECCASD